jgi:hypothetical protein
MPHQARSQALAVFGTLLLAGFALGQEPPAPTVPPLWRIDPVGPAASPPAWSAYEDRNGKLLVGDPALDNPGVGWLGAVEGAAVVPHVRNNVAGFAILPGGATPLVSLPSAPLGWTVSPRVELGYRFGQGFGELIVAYRFLATEGNDTVFLPDAAALHSRIDMQIADLDYGSHEHALGPMWDMKWRVGLRLADIFFDSRAANATLEQHASNRFIGAGPHASLDLRRKIADTGLSLFGRVDASSPIGRISQSFETVAIAPDGTRTGGAGNQGQNYPPVSLAVQLGLSWCPAECPGFRVTGGWTYEHWWDTGSLFLSPPFSRADLFLQGVFLRAEWNY